ncbi:AraC-like ligand binding domain-containing protein [Paenibacillus sp. UNC496MF]|uniref:AraC family transcriptional regulator n=1 Tax=Paenibacillus sp. UNC496MF TaxID=1502753 RepID=UPI0008E840CA|nr:helix-turn-helix domain-containing protein [Paenibacillus sp. UNC496MF]SFJ45552.1 AraC-like ligand binding domain-containing protein [Paenibacillus sp. UNC496MF]
MGEVVHPEGTGVHMEGSDMPLTLQWQQPIELMYRNDAPMNGAQFHSHAFYEMYYFQEGECNYLIGDKLLTLQPGDLILMHGMTLHCPNPSPEKPYVRTIIHMDPAYVHKILQPDAAAMLLKPFENLRNIRISLNEADQAELEALLAEMNRLYARTNEAGVRTAYERFVLRVIELLHLIRDWCVAPVYEREHRSLKEQHVQSVITYLEDHYVEEITLDDIAGALHLTKPYLSNLFKDVTGTTVFKYLYNRRINQAKMMFRLEPRQSVSEVCRAVGFHQLPHFSRLFKTTVGESPEAYRKRMLRQSAAEGGGSA